MTLRTARSLPPQGLLTLRFDAERFPPTPAACYRASWQLPGPDLPRQATTSLRTDHDLTSSTSALWAHPLGDKHVGPVGDLKHTGDRVVIGDRDEVHAPALGQGIHLVRGVAHSGSPSARWTPSRERSDAVEWQCKSARVAGIDIMDTFVASSISLFAHLHRCPGWRQPGQQPEKLL